MQELIWLKKKSKFILKKTCRAILKLYHFHNPASAAPLPIPAAKQRRGQRPAVKSGSPACTGGQWEPGASEQLQPAQDRGFTAPVMPRCGLLFLPSIGPGSHCMVCEFNRLNWLKTSSFLSLLQQCLANLAPRFSSLHSEASTAGKALPQEQQISLHYETINFSPKFKFQ